MTPRCWIGIDPGASGAIAYHTATVTDAHTFKLMPTPYDVIDYLWWIKRAHGDAHGDGVVAYLERVSSMPRQGVSSTFKFGQHYGMCECALAAAHVPFERVRPAVWQRGMKCLSRGNKNVTKARALELFPDAHVTHATADALLIAEYCRRTWGGA